MLDLQPIKQRLINATKEPYTNRRTINIEIALLVQIIKELEALRSPKQ